MQENEENPVNQEDEMPSLDAAHEYPDQEGASVPAEDNGNENRSRPNRGKQILRAVTEVAGVEDVYETVTLIVKKDENVTPKEKRKKVLDAVLKITGVRAHIMMSKRCSSAETRRKTLKKLLKSWIKRQSAKMFLRGLFRPSNWLAKPEYLFANV